MQNTSADLQIASVHHQRGVACLQERIDDLHGAIVDVQNDFAGLQNVTMDLQFPFVGLQSAVVGLQISVVDRQTCFAGLQNGCAHRQSASAHALFRRLARRWPAQLGRRPARSGARRWRWRRAREPEIVRHTLDQRLPLRAAGIGRIP